MKRTYLTILFLLMLTACSGRSGSEDTITQSKESHLYEGYPLVYVTPGVSSEGVLSAYERLNVNGGKNAAIKVSNTETDPHFAWSKLTGALSQSLDNADVIEDMHLCGQILKTDFQHDRRKSVFA